MSRFDYTTNDPAELDIELVRLGFLTEEERIRRAYQRIHAEQMKRGLFREPSHDRP